NEAGALAFLRHRAIKEIIGNGLRGDVDHRGNHAVVDLDIVLLIGIKLLGTGRFAEFDMSRPRNHIGSRVRTPVMCRKPEEGASEEDAKNEWPCKSHKNIGASATSDCAHEWTLSMEKCNEIGRDCASGSAT